MYRAQSVVRCSPPRCLLQSLRFRAIILALVYQPTITPTFFLHEYAASFPFRPYLESALQALQALRNHPLTLRVYPLDFYYKSLVTHFAFLWAHPSETRTTRSSLIS